MAGWTTLVQPETLAIGLGRKDLVIVDCRFSLLDPSAGEQDYLTSHLPGAAYAHLERDLSEMAPNGDGRHPWPPADAVTARLSRWGIDPSTQVVAYDGGDGAHAARLWFLLRVLGHEKVAVLDGGWSRWTSLGLPVSTAPRPPSATPYRAVYDLGRLCNAAQVQAHLDAGGILLDARAASRFRGEEEPLDRVAGHVPGALRPWRCPAARCAAVAYSQWGGMSGASVSSTKASAGSSTARRRNCSARSYVTAPPKPSLKPMPTKACACCRLPLNAWAIPPCTGTSRRPLSNLSAERRTCRITGRSNRRASCSWAR